MLRRVAPWVVVFGAVVFASAHVFVLYRLSTRAAWIAAAAIVALLLMKFFAARVLHARKGRAPTNAVAPPGE